MSHIIIIIIIYDVVLSYRRVPACLHNADLNNFTISSRPHSAAKQTYL